MRRTIRPNLLYTGSYASPQVHRIDASILNGGINLNDLEYNMSVNQSPDLLNVYWKDGYLASRNGMEYVYQRPAPSNFHRTYGKLWAGYVISHIGSTIEALKINGDNVVRYVLTNKAEDTDNGSFFVFNEKLYYLDRQIYISIDVQLRCWDVVRFVPTVILNRYPDGTGGSTYQSENRISPKKTISFTTDGTSTSYVIPEGYCPLDTYGPTSIKLKFPSQIEYVEYYEVAQMPEGRGIEDAVYKWSGLYHKWIDGMGWVTVPEPSQHRFSVNRETGIITFQTAPSQSDPSTPSNLDVTITSTNEDAEKSILTSKHFITVSGGASVLAVMCAGCDAQSNAFFWSGNTETGLDPGYFPMDYYNFAGGIDDPITGFGMQQANVIVFKERSIGKTSPTVTSIGERDYINFVFTPVNDKIGCDLTDSIQLVNNNLVFANTYGGVYVLGNTSSADENNVRKISENVEGSPDRPGLMSEIGIYKDAVDFVAHASARPPMLGGDGEDEEDEEESTDPPTLPDNRFLSSYDDGSRYWLVVNGKVFLWDYSINSNINKESSLSWFVFNNIPAAGWCLNPGVERDLFFTPDGSIARFNDGFSDFGESIERRYKLAVQNFGSYNDLKDVIKVIIAARSDTGSSMEIKYITDYEERYDRTPIRAFSYSWARRNLATRRLSSDKFAGTFVRLPRCFHIRHFSLVLTSTSGTDDMSITGIEIYYRFAKEDR